MNKEKLRKLAQQIADAEKIIQTSKDKDEIRKAQSTIISLSGKVSLFDLDVLDDMVQEILKKSCI